MLLGGAVVLLSLSLAHPPGLEAACKTLVARGSPCESGPIYPEPPSSTIAGDSSAALAFYAQLTGIGAALLGAIASGAQSYSYPGALRRRPTGARDRR